MRELLIRQTAAEELEAAQAAAIAAIGLRSDRAREAMRKARVGILRKRRDERWKAIVRGAWRTTAYGALATLPESNETETHDQVPQ